jgi:hypothetical protein
VEGSFPPTPLNSYSGFAQEDIVILQTDLFGFDQRVIVRNLPKPIMSKSTNHVRASPNGTLVGFDVNEIYDTRDGQRLSLPPGRKFHPELSQFSEDGRYAVFPPNFFADLAVEKKIGFNSDSRFLTKQNASIDADLLQKWCRVITRGKLDQGGRYSAIDEATWENVRQELARDLDANPDAEVLRSATTDRLYWLRQEIEGTSAPLPLLDRLVAAEPTWTNYDRRAQVHIGLEQWYQAILDELEAARLAGDRYWRYGPAGWMLGARIVQIPGRPHEQYELALRWAEARNRAGVSEVGGGGLLLPSSRVAVSSMMGRTSMIGLAQYRLGRYSDALATLQNRDVPMLSVAAGMLMSPWNLLTIRNDSFTFEPIDLIVRAMCHHQLGQPKAAGICLRMARETWRMAKEGRSSAEEEALLREAELLIEGKAKP